MALSERQQFMLLRWVIWAICVAALINEIFVVPAPRAGVLAFITAQFGLPYALAGGARRRKGGE